FPRIDRNDAWVWSNARSKRRRTVMPSSRPLLRKTHVTTERPPFERIALVLQGGGALGAYQGGVYQALAEANLHPDWVAGISIGAINSASAGKACREVAGI